MGMIKIIMVVNIRGENALITFIWSCTNFLVPKTNGLLLSFKSKKAVLLGTGCRVSSSIIFLGRQERFSFYY